MEKIKNLKEFATKKYGQNFLKDETILEKIVEAIPKDGDGFRCCGDWVWLSLI